MEFFALLYFRSPEPVAELIRPFTFTSPFAAAFSLPLSLDNPAEMTTAANWPVFFNFLAFYAMINASLVWCMLWLFKVRWRVRS